MFDFFSIKKTLKDFADDLSSIRFEIETLTREAEDIQFAPANESDVIKALEVWATDNQAQYHTYLQSELYKLVSAPGDLIHKGLVHRHLYARGFLPDPHAGLPISRDVQMCGLLGPTKFVDLVKAQMSAMNWHDQGLPMVERGPAVAKLQKKIDALRIRESDLLKSADQAGLQVT